MPSATSQTGVEFPVSVWVKKGFAWAAVSKEVGGGRWSALGENDAFVTHVCVVVIVELVVAVCAVYQDGVAVDVDVHLSARFIVLTR